MEPNTHSSIRTHSLFLFVVTDGLQYLQLLTRHCYLKAAPLWGLSSQNQSHHRNSGTNVARGLYCMMCVHLMCVGCKRFSQMIEWIQSSLDSKVSFTYSQVVPRQYYTKLWLSFVTLRGHQSLTCTPIYHNTNIFVKDKTNNSCL